MPITIAPFIAFGLGALLALAPRRGGERTDAETRRAAAWFFAAIFLPLQVHAALAQPGWFIGYLTRAEPAPMLLVLLATGSSFLGPAGVELTQRVPRSEALRRALMATLPVGVGGVVALASPRALTTLGSTAAFAAKSERSLVALSDSEFGLTQAALFGLAGLAYAVTLRHVLRLGTEGRRAPSQLTHAE